MTRKYSPTGSKGNYLLKNSVVLSLLNDKVDIFYCKNATEIYLRWNLKYTLVLGYATDSHIELEHEPIKRKINVNEIFQNYQLYLCFTWDNYNFCVLIVSETFLEIIFLQSSLILSQTLILICFCRNLSWFFRWNCYVLREIVSEIFLEHIKVYWVFYKKK